MDKFRIYDDISRRTDGDIYIGVVGPVRTGKSTFIKRFMETLVLPNILNENKRVRALDELPQSAGGRTIMTTEPKFVPNEAVEISLSENSKLNVRLIDCVGYLVEGALGSSEDNLPRMVRTPWSDGEIPFDRAAEIGTRKVICDHSTIGLVITTDGSIGDIPREAYQPSEQRVVKELSALHKPFILVLNSRYPARADTLQLAADLSQEYGVSVIPVNCMELTENDIKSIMEKVLFEFPIQEINIQLPGWVFTLPHDHWLKESLFRCVTEGARQIGRIRDVSGAVQEFGENEYLKRSSLVHMSLGEGSATVELQPRDGLFYQVIGEETGFEIPDEEAMVTLLLELSRMKREYDKVSAALEEVSAKGYGIVIPSIEELHLEEPVIVKQGSRYGVRLKASAPSIHMIRADIETEVSPIVGSEKQSEELVKYLLEEFEENPQKIWESNLFGKSLHELVNEGLVAKLNRTPEEAREKLQETLSRIVNEGSGGLICIIL
ncbi:MAG: stage IV sporulation protein A [Clostridia bacterium]|nr:stage IV sporulation protein A [Clostridia bacterium]